MARILLVDDVKLFRHLEATVLGSYGYEIEEASSGEEALSKIRANPPDLALIDINMPGMDGLEVCRQIKEDPALLKIPVIMVSASNKEEDIRHAIESGCDEYLTKPLDDTALIRKVEILLGKVGKRRFPRVPTSLQVSFENFKGIFFEYTHDVSRTGVFIEMDKPLAVGTRLRLSFSLPPPYDHTIMAFGRVVRVAQPTAERPGGMGVNFICLDEKSAAVIDELAAKSVRPEEQGAFARLSYQAEDIGLGTPSPDAVRAARLKEERDQLKASLDELQTEHLRQSATLTLVESLHAERQPKQLITAALDILSDLMGVAVSGVFLFDPQKKLLFSAGYRGLPASVAEHLPLQGPLQQVLEQATLLVPDPPWPVPGAATELLAAAPVLFRDQVLGIITVNRLYAQKPHLTARDLGLLELLGRHLGSALGDAVARAQAGDQLTLSEILKAVL
jgi:uncharacterized protein (TIGR02266 family)